MMTLYYVTSITDVINESEFFPSCPPSLFAGEPCSNFNDFFLLLLREAMELCLIMLISTGWGVIFTNIQKVHRTILGCRTYFLFFILFF